MNTKWLPWFMLLLYFAFAQSLTPPAWSQVQGNDPVLENGTKPYGSFGGSSNEAVNMLNGKLYLHYPLISFPQRGGKLQMSFSIVYVNNLFKIRLQDFPNQPGSCNPDRPNSCQQLLSLSQGGIAIVPEAIPEAVTSSNGTSISYFAQFPDMTAHTFASLPSGATSEITIDGSAYALSLDNNGGQCQTISPNTPVPYFHQIVTDKVGSRFTYSCYGLFTGAVDTNGNQIVGNSTVPAGANPPLPILTGFTDTLGRVISLSPSADAAPLDVLAGGRGQSTSDLSSCSASAGSASLWSLPGPGSSTLTYKVCFTTIYINLSNCPAGSTRRCTTDNTIPYARISDIILPNNTAFRFQYDTANPNNTSVYGAGDLTQITYPTGGSSSFVWGVFQAVCTNPYQGRRIVSRTRNANDGTTGTWTYTTGFPSTHVSTETDPLLNQTVHTFTNLQTGACAYYETQTQYYQGSSSSGTLLKTNTTQYHSDSIVGGTIAANVLPTTQTLTWANGQTSSTQLSYAFDVALYQTSVLASYGNVTSKNEHDYGSGSPGALVRQTTTAYQYQSASSYQSKNLVSLPATVATYDGSGVLRAQTTYGYDENNGSPQGTLGNPTSTTRWLNGGTSPKLQTVFNSQGMPSKTIDPNGNQTAFTYDSTGAYLIQVQYPATGTVQHIEKFSFDTNTGLLLSDADQNNNTTSYKYNDPLLRLTEVDFPGGGQTLVSYNDALPSPTKTTSVKQNTQGNFLSVASVFDGLGRTIQTQLTTDPAGTDYVDTSYDGLGHISKQSNPHRSTSAPTDGTTTYSYDALGRVTQVTRPDGSTVPTTYTGRATQVQDEGNGAQRITRISQTDGLDRLASVCEVASGPFVGSSGASSSSLIGSGGTPAACGQDITGTGFVTTYQYDALDNLLQVNQAGVANRTYTYDTLSELLSVFNPESGTTNYAYDPAGNFLTKTDARGIKTTLQYDALNRIISKTFSDSTASITNTYDVAVDGLAVNYPVGRLVKSATSNTATVNSYDPMGRVATQWQCTPQNCGSGYFSLPYVYDLMGNITSAGNGMGVTIAYGVDGAAQIASVTSSLLDETHPSVLLSNADYNPFGSMGSSALGNGTSESFAYDSRGRLQNISTNGATPSRGSATVSGSEQSTAGAPTSGTGSVTFSGTLQSKQVQTQAPAPGSGSVTVNGTLQSQQTAATAGTGSVAFSAPGTIQTYTFDPCAGTGHSCPQTVSNTGSITFTVAGQQFTINYTGNASQDATAMQTAINQGSSYVTAPSVSGSTTNSTMNLTAKTTGTGSNYAMSCCTYTWNIGSFNGTPFFSGPNDTASSGSSLTGGTDASTVYDSGSCTIVVNSGPGDSATWNGSGTTSSSIASALASSINGDSKALVSASSLGSTVTLTATTSGANTNYSLSSSCSSGMGSFTTSNSGSALTNGRDASYKTVYDSGTSTITVKGHPDSFSWSGSATTTFSIASALISQINGDSAAFVTAAPTPVCSGNACTINLTATTAGASTNYTLSSSSTYDSSNFSSASFSSNSGTTLTGGNDAGATTYDSGSVWITVNGTQYSVGYGQGSTAASLASSLAQAINANSGSPVTATASPTTVTLVSNEGGPSTNYSLSAGSSTNQSSTFPKPSFTISASGSVMTGGATSGTVYTLALTYAPNGDIASANDSVNGNWGYSYDAFNRLTCSNLASNGSCSSPTSGTPTYSYVYDRFGNRWQQNGPHAFTTSFTGNNSTNNNRMDGYSYDAAGNLLNDGSHQYFYDAENRVIQVDGTLGNCSTATACLVYNAIGQRVQKTTSSGTVNYLYDLAEHQIAETNSSGGWNRGEVYAGDRHLATYVNSTTYFIHPDWLGTERSRTNLNGGLYETCTNLPFGDGFNCSASDISPMHFTGQQHDNESGLDHFEQRKYGSLMGRWTSPDLLPGDQSDPQSLNRYAYARNNPVILIDLFGLQDSFRTGVCGILDDSGTIQPIDCGDLEQLNNLPVNTSDLSAAAQLQPQPEPSQQDLVAGSVTDLTTLAGGGTASTSSTLSGVQTALDLAGVIPFVGDFANAASGMISLSQGHYGAALLSFASALPFAGTAAEAIKIGKLGEEGVQGFKTFRAFKRFYGAAEEGMQWHHIVEQGGGRVARFGPEAIHNVENLVEIPTEIHRKISAYYSSIDHTYSDSQTVRQWLKSKSFEEQWQFGQEVLRRLK